jgi:hypothetical protein
MAQHKWHKEIKAWADGAEIERYVETFDEWIDDYSPIWYIETQYRIKPQPKKPQYLYVFQTSSGNFSCRKKRHGFEYIGEYIGKIKLEVDDD